MTVSGALPLWSKLVPFMNYRRCLNKILPRATGVMKVNKLIDNIIFLSITHFTESSKCSSHKIYINTQEKSKTQ